MIPSQPTLWNQQQFFKSIKSQVFSLVFKNFNFVFFTIRYHGSLSSIKFHVCHHVGGRTHTPVVCDQRWKLHSSHYPSRPVKTKNNQETTHSSHYPSRLVKAKTTICNEVLQTQFCRSQFLDHRPHCQSEEPLRSVASEHWFILVKELFL